MNINKPKIRIYIIRTLLFLINLIFISYAIIIAFFGWKLEFLTNISALERASGIIFIICLALINYWVFKKILKVERAMVKGLQFIAIVLPSSILALLYIPQVLMLFY